MIKLFTNETSWLGSKKRIKRIVIKLSRRRQKKFKIRKLKKLLNVKQQKIKNWEKAGKLDYMLKNLEMIEFFIFLTKSGEEDTTIYKKDFSYNEPVCLSVWCYLYMGIMTALIIYMLIQFIYTQNEIKESLNRLSELAMQ